MIALQLQRGVHEPVTTPLAGFLQREVHKDLFTYWHQGENVWVVALWVNKSRGQCREVTIVGGTLADANRPMIDFVRQWMTSDLRSNMQFVRSNARAQAREQMDNEAEWMSMKHHEMKRLGARAPHAMIG